MQPYTVGLRFTATEKLASISKGIAVGTHGNILHLGADYAYSSQDPRLPEQAFQRVGVQIAHTKDFASASLRINLRGYWMQDKGGKGRNTIDGEYQKAFSRGLSFSANGQWNLNSSWITNLEYHAGLTFDYQKMNRVLIIQVLSRSRLILVCPVNRAPSFWPRAISAIFW